MHEMAATLHTFPLLLYILCSLVRIRTATALLMLMGLVGCAHPPVTPHEAYLDERIFYYIQKVAGHPRLYPAYALLGVCRSICDS